MEEVKFPKYFFYCWGWNPPLALTGLRRHVPVKIKLNIEYSNLLLFLLQSVGNLQLILKSLGEQKANTDDLGNRTKRKWFSHN